ncbi:hypothetical protein ACFPT7_06990 [Acidicapsa dinghuensis]|uniref:DUF4138 domain-containing protein n=1 Tax=Acidicapsa dinghuensis TaxID=2218256 RepID=A0ABW1EFK1_9BACT|nr:hypothetical protein [Acidicapsa dinghuensis]
MRYRWMILLVILVPLSLSALETPVKARIETVLIDPAAITPLHLRPGFISTIRMPEEINSVALGSRTEFSADHSEGEPRYVYVKPITKEPAQSNLVIATKSGLHVTLELISDGDKDPSSDLAVDFLLEYDLPHSFLISASSDSDSTGAGAAEARTRNADGGNRGATLPRSELDEEYAIEMRVNAPSWAHWDGEQIETSLGDIRQLGNRTAVSFSVLNRSARPVEIVPPQIQIAGRKQKKKKKGATVISDQLEIRDYRLSATRLGAGERADGVVVFDRPNFKQSTEKLFLQISQADQVDRPILIHLPFTPPFSGNPAKEEQR